MDGMCDRLCLGSGHTVVAGKGQAPLGLRGCTQVSLECSQQAVAGIGNGDLQGAVPWVEDQDCVRQVQPLRPGPEL